MSTLAPLGLGAAAIGNLFRARTNADAEATVRAVVTAGLDYIDTAPLYGFGLSERRIGAALSSLDGAVAISTKVGRVLDPLGAGEPPPDLGFIEPQRFRPVFDYSADGAARSLEGSMARLGRDHLDVVLVHDLGVRTHGADHPERLAQALTGAFPRLARWKAEGVVGRIGLGVNEAEIAELVMDRFPLDVVLLAGRHTLLEQDARDRGFFARCGERNVSVILGGVFNSGLLVDPADAAARHDYAPAPQALRARAQAISAVCAAHGVALPAAALAFCRALEGVERVLIGPGDVAESAQCLAWAETPIPDDLWPALGLRP